MGRITLQRKQCRTCSQIFIPFHGSERVWSLVCDIRIPKPREYWHRVYIRHKAKRAAYQKEYRKGYYLKNKAKLYQLSQNWIKQHPVARAHYNRLAQAKRKNLIGRYTQAEWLELVRRFDYRCLKCFQRKSLTVDHVQPITKGGSNYILNIQPLCKSCNSAKHNHYQAFKPELLLPAPAST